jgi:hypothetical protein
MAKAKKSTKSKTSSSPDQPIIQLRVFDGTRMPLANGTEILVRVRDGNQRELVSKFFSKSSLDFTKLPFSDNLADNFTVLVTADGYRDAGFFPVKISPDLPASVNLMLVPRKAKYQFLAWSDFKAKYGRFADFLCCAGPDAGRTNYEQLTKEKPAGLASLLNLTAAMSVIQLPVGTPLDYFKRIEWADSLAQDRFFGFADQQLVQQVRTAAAQGAFAPEPAPGLFHGDATSSFKQVQFGEANVQLTFHENTVEKIGGVSCIRVEPDTDYYKDLGAHTLLEVIPNTLSHGLTDPQVVYVLRWIAGRHAGVAEFDPSYTLIA